MWLFTVISYLIEVMQVPRAIELQHKAHVKVRHYVSFVHLLRTALQTAEIKAYLK